MSGNSGQRFPSILLTAATITLVAWGALAFGAVYPWAYTPLAIGCAVLGGALLLLERRGRPKLATLAAALAAIAIAVSLQLVALPGQALATISPNVPRFLHDYEQTFGVLRPIGAEAEPATDEEAPRTHALSISPDRTLIGLGLFAALALFLLGTTRQLSVTGGLALVRPIIGLGIALAVFGIGQAALTEHDVHPLVYGFWKPQSDSRPFGPFINPNHFAGWMLMALPLALAWFYDGLQRTLNDAASYKRNRIALASSPEFATLMTAGFAAVVMGLSLLLTRSRSGLGAFAAASALAAWAVVRRQRSAGARAVVVAAFMLLLTGAGLWAGLTTVTSKFFEAEETNQGLASVGGRLVAWRDTLTIIRSFPLAGTGLNTYGAAMAVYQTGNRGLHFQEAHNDYLQIAAEGGLLVALPVLAMCAIFIRDVRRRFREAPQEGTTYWLRVGAVIGLVAIGLQSLVEFSLQMPGNAALFCVLAAIALHRSPHLRPSAALGVSLKR